jgi:serine/threonine protein kinase
MLSDDRLHLTLTSLHSAHVDPVPIHPASHQGTTDVPNPQAVNGPFRILRHLAEGGFATAMGAEDLASGRLMCLKVFRKDRLKKKRTKRSILNELEIYKRIACSRECCPATIFLMELETSFQTKKFVCFAMVCASPLCAI